MALDGFLNLLKPPGMTSHDVVAFVRARLSRLRTGHLGTLDPAAAGVLPISLGRATRLFRFAAGTEKAYRAEVTFGITTDSFDSEGRITGVRDSSHLSQEALNGDLEHHTGDILQTPPAFSAAHVNGKRMYQLARRGQPVEAEPRKVRIEELKLIAFSSGPRATALLDIVCSPGTYIRSLAADLGDRAGCGAHLSFLLRTRAGRFSLDHAVTLEEVAAACQDGEISDLLLPLDWPLNHLPVVELPAAQAQSFLNGSCVLTTCPEHWPVRVYAPGTRFLGLGEVGKGGRCRPRVVLRTRGNGDPCD